MENSNFNNNNFLLGGALYVLEPTTLAKIMQFSQILLINSVFSFNTAYKNGGVIKD